MSTSLQQVASDRLAVSADELADMLNISKRHLDALHASGRLPRPVRLGRRCLWPIDEVRAWLAAGAPGRDKWEALRTGEGT